jgi:flagellar protein FliL
MSDVNATAEELNEPLPARKGGLWKAMLGVLLLAGLGAAGAWYLGFFDVDGADDAAEAKVVLPPPIYFDVDDNMVVNFQGGGRLRYLQVGVQLMTRDPAAVAALQQHRPVLRNNLIMLFSEQSFETLSSREGKTALQEAALAEVQALLGEDHPGTGVEAVYFTSFVMQ